jgi:hypothetical protein
MEYSKTEMGIEGLGDFQRVISELPQNLNKNVWNSIFNRVLRDTIKPELEAGCPDVKVKDTKKSWKKGTEVNVDLKKTIQIQVGKSTGKDIPRMLIGFNTDGYLMRIMEYSHEQARSTKKGYNRGILKAKPFVGRLYFSKMNEVIKYIEDNAKDIAEKYLTRAIKRMNK